MRRCGSRISNARYSGLASGSWVLPLWRVYMRRSLSQPPSRGPEGVLTSGPVAPTDEVLDHGPMSAMPADEIKRLPVSERLKLVEQIWDSIREHPEDVPVTDAQRAELDRRLEAHRADPDAASDVDEVITRLRGRE